MIRVIIVAVVAFLAGYGFGRRLTQVEMRVLDLYMQQLDRIRTEDL
jgi:hypothetical protein